MGRALVRGMTASGIAPGHDITVSSKSPESARHAAQLLGTHSASSNEKALESAGVVFLCVKPFQALSVVASVAAQLQGKLLVSIVAGIHSPDLLASAGGGIRLIRAMPNTAVRLRKGLTAIAPDPSATPEDVALAHRIFSSLGTALEVRETDLDTITALSGSGPAFALFMLESMAQGGIEGGLDPETSKQCAAASLSAAAALVLETGETPLALRTEITSPGGTTEAGLEVLANREFPSIVRDAISAARHRSMELSAKTTR